MKGEIALLHRHWSHLKSLEHVREWCQPYQEMAHDHRGAKMGAVMKRLLPDTLKVLVARLGCLTPCWG
jgi:hypothetical protein